jgi:ribosomal protein S18 acetylase RimI-like enzyme
LTAAITINHVPVVYREFRDDDEGFVYNSWLKSFREGSSWADKIPAQVYFSNHKKVVSKLLSESGIVIAANPECPDQIFGYGVYQPTTGHVTVLHYIYVKHSYRKLGIAADILRMISQLSSHDTALPMAATHITGNWDALKNKWNLFYNPYVIGAMT